MNEDRRKEAARLISQSYRDTEFRSEALAKSILVADADGFITAAQAKTICAEICAPRSQLGYEVVTLEEMSLPFCGLWEPFDDGARYRVVCWWIIAPPPADAAASHVYFVQVGVDGPIKIGRSTDIRRRINELQTSNPHRLRLLAAIPGGVYLERILHVEFHQNHLNGEWFKPTPYLLEFIREIGGNP